MFNEKSHGFFLAIKTETENRDRDVTANNTHVTLWVALYMNARARARGDLSSEGLYVSEIVDLSRGRQGGRRRRRRARALRKIRPRSTCAHLRYVIRVRYVSRMGPKRYLGARRFSVESRLRRLAPPSSRDTISLERELKRRKRGIYDQTIS